VYLVVLLHLSFYIHYKINCRYSYSLMTQNFLKLNDNKTNIYLASPHCVKSLTTPALQMGASLITPKDTKSRSYFWPMYEHVTSVCWAAYCHLKNIHCLKVFLTQEALVIVVHAFVTSCIDYSNSLLYGISDYDINCLQRIQNSAACIVTNTKKIWSYHPNSSKTTLATC